MEALNHRIEKSIAREAQCELCITDYIKASDEYEYADSCPKSQTRDIHRNRCPNEALNHRLEKSIAKEDQCEL